MMTKRWIMLPGMGASSTMYYDLGLQLRFNIQFIDWPSYKGETSYRQVARRIIEENGLTGQEIVGGSSLGGMVALEIANLANTRTVVLIGSAMHSGEVPPLLSLLSPLAAFTPMFMFQTVASSQPDPISAMLAESDPDFVRAMCLHLPAWQGYRTAQPTRVYRIHGKMDNVIPCPSTDCEVIEDAGHFLAITHPKEVAAFLEKVRTEVSK